MGPANALRWTLAISYIAVVYSQHGQNLYSRRQTDESSTGSLLRTGSASVTAPPDASSTEAPEYCEFGDSKWTHINPLLPTGQVLTSIFRQADTSEPPDTISAFCVDCITVSGEPVPTGLPESISTWEHGLVDGNAKSAVSGTLGSSLAKRDPIEPNEPTRLYIRVIFRPRGLAGICL